MREDRILPGVILMLGFCAVAPFIDAFAKLASARIPVGEITAARFFGQAVLMLPVVFALRLPLRLQLRSLAVTALRATLLMVSTYTFVSAIAVMPLADALAIFFVAPFILLLLGRVLFGEPVGPRRVGACLFGFLGALLVIRPNATAIGSAALLPLTTALLFALYMLITRAQSRTAHPVAMQFHTAWTGLLICAAVLLLADGSGHPELDPVWPIGIDWVWLAGVGAAAAVSHLAITYALAFAPSATLAPLQYLELVMSVTLGYLIFGNFPTPFAWAGIAVIVASGLYIIHRERLTAKGTGALTGQPPEPL
ncbi:MAG: DMT family transporter [Paracoccaceae bacterium]